MNNNHRIRSVWKWLNLFFLFAAIFGYLQGVETAWIWVLVFLLSQITYFLRYKDEPDQLNPQTRKEKRTLEK